MSGNESGMVDLKTIGAIIGICAALAGAVGSWYVNDYRLNKLEEANGEVTKKIDEVKCLVAKVHEIPLPECNPR